mgnify:CR=1 FL=1
MAEHSNIEWTEATWNPVTGCSKVSTGCKHCYAERLAHRLQAMGNVRYRNGFTVTLHPAVLDLPKRWRQPRMIFVNSMSDLFHEHVPLEFIQRVFATMRDCPQDDLPLDGIHWVIVGGESGPGARPMQAAWVRSILEQCRRAHVPFFFKQWGGVRKDLTGRELDGRTYNEMPSNGRQH